MLNGGDVSWLTEGLKKVDEKLIRIAELNEIMAFRPWIIGSGHIESLLKSEDRDPKKSWSIPEVL